MLFPSLGAVWILNEGDFSLCFDGKVPKESRDVLCACAGEYPFAMKGLAVQSSVIIIQFFLLQLYLI